ncbi:C-GCAxxG-C-C family (seleno)protein [Clostridium sp.]|uniref:C-GCAxxG-C-C family (seleno)protein n=1 Tax=Clostridium sp. TaxID=1506 RepID=UPI0029148B0A|nr:C-GCAxxG-C-C family (seleno)protein [Clostridium sp.]MDU5106793.1 C-GCAxxG-C-C family (seleno)protein [Clostridium sp.]
MTKPSVHHSQGYTCAEAIIKAYNEEHNTDIPVALGSGMGTGMTVGSICGAVNASAIIIGYLKGRENNERINEARGYSRELMNTVREKFNTEICKDLKKNKISCEEIIDFSYKSLNELINK